MIWLIAEVERYERNHPFGRCSDCGEHHDLHEDGDSLVCADCLARREQDRTCRDCGCPCEGGGQCDECRLGVCSECGGLLADGDFERDELCARCRAAARAA